VGIGAIALDTLPLTSTLYTDDIDDRRYRSQIDFIFVYAWLVDSQSGRLQQQLGVTMW